MQRQLAELTGHDHARVRPYGKHLLIQMHRDDAVDTVARLTEVARNKYTAASDQGPVQAAQDGVFVIEGHRICQVEALSSCPSDRRCNDAAKVLRLILPTQQGREGLHCACLRGRADVCSLGMPLIGLRDAVNRNSSRLENRVEASTAWGYCSICENLASPSVSSTRMKP